MPSPELCTLTGEVLNIAGTARAAAGTRVTVKRVRGAEYAHATAWLDFRVNADGELETLDSQPARVPQGTYVTFQGAVEGWERAAEVAIPEVSEYEFRLLEPATGAAPSTGATQVALAAEIARATTAEEDLAADLTAHAATEESARLAASVVFTQSVSVDVALDIGDALRALILIDTSAGDVTITLQPAADMAHREIILKKTADNNLAIVDGDGSETIDGALVFNLEMLNQFVRLMPVSGAWYIV